MEGYKIRPTMRAILIDWMVEVHLRFKLLQETLYLTVAVLDRFLQVKQLLLGHRLFLNDVSSLLM